VIYARNQLFEEDEQMPKILIVDDEQRTREAMEQALEELEDQGVELILAGNGMEALEAIRQQKPDLVFLDVLMPKMNGLEVCKAVKDQPGMQDVHIVMLTTEGQDYENQRVSESSANGSIMKPIDPDEIYEKAIAILGLSQ
jgi:two-component system, OmpR family, alkaline phosphatase synthesis response regulator PhoP